MRDYYFILGISDNASNREIKEAYRKLALKLHPDKNNGDKFFEEYFRNLKDAYETLSDPKRRDLYDLVSKVAHSSKANTIDPLQKKREQEKREQEEMEYNLMMQESKARDIKWETPLTLKEYILIVLTYLIIPFVMVIIIPFIYVLRGYGKKGFNALLIGIIYLFIIVILMYLKRYS